MSTGILYIHTNLNIGNIHMLWISDKLLICRMVSLWKRKEAKQVSSLNALFLQEDHLRTCIVILDTIGFVLLYMLPYACV